MTFRWSPILLGLLCLTPFSVGCRCDEEPKVKPILVEQPASPLTEEEEEQAVAIQESYVDEGGDGKIEIKEFVVANDDSEVKNYNTASLVHSGTEAIYEATQAQIIEFNDSRPLVRVTVQAKNMLDEDLDWLAELTDVEILEIAHGQKLTDDVFSHLASLTNLRQITLSDCPKIDGSGFYHLAGLTDLDMLGVVGSQATGENLGELANLYKLTILNIPRSPINDDGLAQIAKLQSLRRLNLTGSKVTDAGIDHLKSITGLRFINVEKTGITKEGYKSLKEAFPKARVLWIKPRKK